MIMRFNNELNIMKKVWNIGIKSLNLAESIDSLSFYPFKYIVFTILPTF